MTKSLVLMKHYYLIGTLAGSLHNDGPQQVAGEGPGQVEAPDGSPRHDAISTSKQSFIEWILNELFNNPSLTGFSK